MMKPIAVALRILRNVMAATRRYRAASASL
jgi:hypothetical protein